MWFVFALLSAVFAALTSILAKVGIDGVNSNLATAVRTVHKTLVRYALFITQLTENGDSLCIRSIRLRTRLLDTKAFTHDRLICDIHLFLFIRLKRMSHINRQKHGIIYALIYFIF